MTYFRMGNPHYHRRGVVSLSCSGWEGVGPTRYGRQTNWYQKTEDRRQIKTSFASGCCRDSEEVKTG